MFLQCSKCLPIGIKSHFLLYFWPGFPSPQPPFSLPLLKLAHIPDDPV